MPQPDAHPERLYCIQVAFSEAMNRPAVCYLVRLSDGSHVLIDSGLPDVMPPGLPPPTEPNVVEQLAQIGLQPADITLIVCTHYDIDHAGHHADFPHAEYVAQRDHYADAQTNPRYAFVRPQWDQPVERIRLVDGDVDLFPGFRLLRTDGHATGHQAVLLTLPQTGPVLLTIDAVQTQRRFTPDVTLSIVDEDEAQLRASTQKLLDLAASANVALTIFGHDGDQWRQLKKLPAYYE